MPPNQAQLSPKTGTGMCRFFMELDGGSCREWGDTEDFGSDGWGFDSLRARHTCLLLGQIVAELELSYRVEILHGGGWYPSLGDQNPFQAFPLPLSLKV